MISLFRDAHTLCVYGVSLGALMIAASCASGVQITPPLIEECGGEEACEPGCYVDMDCSEGERCVEGRCLSAGVSWGALSSGSALGVAGGGLWQVGFRALPTLPTRAQSGAGERTATPPRLEE